MKKLFFALIILACVLICGCSAAADMEYGIDEDNTAYANINISVSVPEFSGHEKYLLHETLQDLNNYYRDTLGFDTDYDYFIKNKDIATVRFTLEKQGGNFEEAFDYLKEMMTDEGYSPFSTLEMEHSDTKNEYVYRIKGRIDAHRVIENTMNSGISDGVISDLKDHLDSTSLCLTLTMPDDRKITKLSFKDPTEIEFEGSFAQTQPLPTAYILIGSGLGTALFGTVFIISLAVSKKRKKQNVCDGVITDKNEMQETEHIPYEEKNNDTL